MDLCVNAILLTGGQVRDGGEVLGHVSVRVRRRRQLQDHRFQGMIKQIPLTA
jgi:hypothetical protein